MKIEKTASGSKKITMSKVEWLHIGKQAGWTATAMGMKFNPEEIEKNVGFNVDLVKTYGTILPELQKGVRSIQVMQNKLRGLATFENDQVQLQKYLTTFVPYVEDLIGFAEEARTAREIGDRKLESSLTDGIRIVHEVNDAIKKFTSSPVNQGNQINFKDQILKRFDNILLMFEHAQQTVVSNLDAEQKKQTQQVQPSPQAPQSQPSQAAPAPVQ